MTTTNVPAVQFTPAGVVVPAQADVLTGVQADINSAFGGGVDPGLSTPQGQIAQSLAAIVGDKNGQIAEVANQVNPDVADGRWQDAIGRIYFLTRIAASGTVVTAVCSGLIGTVIPAGSVAQDANGYRYASTVAATIGPDGTVNVQFQNLTMGPIPCSPGSLATIYTAVTGWESLTNPGAGALGTNVETRADFEARRRNSVAINAVNSVQAIYANVLAVDNVIDAFVIDNPTDAIVNYGSTAYPLAKHSVCVSVAGGNAADIAAAIWAKKPPGCNYNGNTSAQVTDKNYAQPQPVYTVTWLTPAPTAVHIAVQIADADALPANIIDLVKVAVVAAFNGTNGNPRARIGSTIYASRYYAPVSAVDGAVQILSILMGKGSDPVTSAALTFGIDELPTITQAHVAVTLV